MAYKVLITTSGVGSRLGELTKYTNKSLVRIGKKPVLSHIIDKYDVSIPLVITTGYYASHVKEFCKLAYPNRDITFVDVDNYDGEGSSLAYSMLKAKDHLQQPFIFHAGDTLIEGDIKDPLSQNWVAGVKTNDSTQYTSFTVQGERITEFLPKGSTSFDYIHIALVGINSYDEFWKSLQKVYGDDPKNSNNSDVTAFHDMIKNDVIMTSCEVEKWYDVGNTTSLEKTRNTFPDQFDNLDKVDESLFIIDDFVIKFFHNPSHISGRVKRASYLGDLVPVILESTTNFYKYEYCDGLLLSDNMSRPLNEEFLEWAGNKLFVKPRDLTVEEQAGFKQICMSFYKTKTENRINEFYKKYNFEDKEDIINGELTPKLSDLFAQIDFKDWLCVGDPTKFHGDFHYNNVVKIDAGFKLIDWRQDFGGIYEYGDLYYDLAKLYHGLIVNHQIIHRNLFDIEENANNVRCEILRPQILVECEEQFLDFIRKKGYDVRKVKVLTALIYLNIACLHHHPYDKFLYYFGKQMLNKVLE